MLEESSRAIHNKVKEVLNSILKKEIHKAYKMPLVVSFSHEPNLQAFASFDFRGKGYIVAQDIYSDKINYKMPLT